MEDIDINRPCPSWLLSPGMRPDFSKLFLSCQEGEGEEDSTSPLSVVHRIGKEEPRGKEKLLVYHALLNHVQASQFIASVNASVQQFIETEGLFMGEQMATAAKMGSQGGGSSRFSSGRFFQRAVLVSSEFPEEGIESAMDRICCALNEDIPKLTPQPDLLVVKFKRTLDGTEIVDRLSELLFHGSNMHQLLWTRGRPNGLTVLVVFHA